MLPHSGVSFEPKGAAAGSVEIILGGERVVEPRHLTHSVFNVRRIVAITGRESFEDGLALKTRKARKHYCCLKYCPSSRTGLRTRTRNPRKMAGSGLVKLVVPARGNENIRDVQMPKIIEPSLTLLIIALPVGGLRQPKTSSSDGSRQ